MPYYLGGVIKERENLLVTPVERMRNRYNLGLPPSPSPSSFALTLVNLDSFTSSQYIYQTGFEFVDESHFALYSVIWNNSFSCRFDDGD